MGVDCHVKIGCRYGVIFRVRDMFWGNDMYHFRRLSALLLGSAAVVMMSGAAAASPASAAVDLPDGMTASYVVFDRATGATTARDEHKQYRSASVVKLFIALDYLESHGPDYVIPPEDLALLEPMLRSSDDDAASVLWVRDGWERLRPYGDGQYATFLSDEGADGIRSAYGDRLVRLTALKDRYDPANAFRLNPNIPPSKGENR